MRVCFLSEKQCALTAGGAYLGIVDGFERYAEIDPADGLFIEMKPIGYKSVSFCFDEDFLFAPPRGVKLYFLRGGVAVCACDFLREEAEMRVLKEEQLGGLLLTLCVRERVTLTVRGGGGEHTVPLSDAYENARFSMAGRHLLVEGEGCFCLLTARGEVLVSSDGKVTERGVTVKAEVPFHDSMGHVGLLEWEDGVLRACVLRAPEPPKPVSYALALFESVLIGADPAPFLAESLRGRAAALKDYLGKFESVALTADPAVLGLVYPRKERVFDVRYFRVEEKDGKVENLIPVE